MAVTRIKNNQITDASGANTQLGVNAAVKLQNYSVTAGKLANSLVYGSDLTVQGNLTVNGQTTTVDTVNTLIKDPILTLADGQVSGTPTVDIGLLGLRGANNSSFIGWQETGQTFMAILSNTTASNTTVNVSSYANFTASTITAQANLSVIGNIVGAANFTSNVTAGNLISTALVQGVTVSASGNVIGGNVTTGGLISATGNATAGNVLTGGIISASGNLTAGNISTAGNVSASYFIGNISGNIDAAGANTQVQFNDVGDILGASAGFTFNKVGNILTANGNINGANVSTAGTVTAASVVGGVITGSSTSVTGTTTAASVVGGVITGSSTSVTGTTTAASVVGGVITGSSTSVTGTTTAASVVGGVITGSSTSVTGTTTAASVVGGVITGTSVSVTGNVTSLNLFGTSASVSGNVTTPVVTSTGVMTISTGSGDLTLNPTGNVTMSSKNINSLADPVQDQDAATKFYVDSVATGLDIKASVLAATNANLNSYSSGTVSYNNGTSGVGATLTTTGAYTTIDGANVQTANTRVLVKNEANATWNGIYVYSNSTVLTRSSDFNQPNEVAGAYTFVESGTTWADTGWVCTTNNPVVFGTTSIVFVQFSGAGSYTANTAAGISLTGSVFSALVDNNTTAFDGGGNIIVKAGANLTTPNIGAATGTSLSVTGAVNAGTTMSATGNLTAGNVLTGGLVSATANITGGNVLTGGLISASGNTTSGNVLTGGLISASGNITGANVNVGSGSVSTTGNVYAGNVINTGISSVTGNIIGGNVLTGGLVSATGNITGGNLLTSGSGGAISGTGNITGGNILTGGLISATGNITGANINGTVYGNVNATTVSAAGNVTGGNVLTGGLVSATGNITGGNVLTGGLISATSTITSANNITGGNILTGGLVSAAGNITGSNLILSSGFIDGPASGRVTINGSDADVDFAVDGDTLANVFYVDAGTGTASFGTSTQVTNAIVNFSTTNSIKLPVGITGQRPGTGVTGMLRFNSTTNGLEIYNNTEWAPVGSTTFTVIADEQFNGDGSTVAFTLATSQTTNSCIVSINGVVQIPTSAYSVSTTTLTFTEAPAAGDLIDVRELTTTTTVNALSNGTTDFTIATAGGNAAITVGGVANVLVVTPTDVIVTGNLTVTGNATLSGNILGDRIQNGTTTIDIQTVNGNANITVAGTSNVAVFSNTGAYVTGIVSVSGNITGGNVSATNLTGTTVSATGNVTGGNLITASGFIVNGGSNGVGNIGTSSTYFNTVFAKATSAQYADLAEKYVADAEYAPGVVVSFGGDKEVTRSEVDADRAVAGVVSTNPSYIMNATLEAEHVAVVAFTGRVPTSVTGSVAKGDLMVSNGDGTARSEADPKAGSIIGKALENFSGDAGVIEVVIGRF